MIRLLVVDDHEVVRAGLRTLLEDQDRIEVVGEAATAVEALDLIETREPQVVLLDVRLPDQSGVDVCREIRARWPSVQVLMLTSYPDQDAVLGSIMAGAAGYLLKGVRGSALAEAIRTVAGGGSLLDPAVTAQVLEQVRAPRAPADPVDILTDQEMRILRLLAAGHTNREIGAAIHLSEKTVKHYVSNIFNKLGVNRRVEAAAALTRYEARG